MPSHRSEEHTSELQSHDNLVCRLLLEKKKTNHNTTTNTPHKTPSSPYRAPRLTTPVMSLIFFNDPATPEIYALPYTTLFRSSTRLNSSHTIISYAVFWSSDVC